MSTSELAVDLPAGVLRGGVVIVTGSPGTGKTTLCAHLARESTRGVRLVPNLAGLVVEYGSA